MKQCMLALFALLSVVILVHVKADVDLTQIAGGF